LNAIFSKIVIPILLSLATYWLGTPTNLEFTQKSFPDAFTSALGDTDGFAIKYKDTELSKVSMLEIQIFNRTGHQVKDVELQFKIDNKETDIMPVAARVIQPEGYAKDDACTKVSIKDPTAIRYKCPIVPKSPFLLGLLRKDGPSLDFVFFFSGAKTPRMHFISFNELGIEEYGVWKDVSVYLFFVVFSAYAFYHIMLALFGASATAKAVKKFEDHLRIAKRTHPEWTIHASAAIQIYADYVKKLNSSSLFSRLNQKD
jgi:hypothetical protein